MHHIRGIWNGIWSDQFIESTFMRYGHGSGGIIGIAIMEEVLKVCALNRHLCCKTEVRMNDMEEDETANSSHLYHKEESKTRIETDYWQTSKKAGPRVSKTPYQKR